MIFEATVRIDTDQLPTYNEALSAVTAELEEVGVKLMNKWRQHNVQSE